MEKQTLSICLQNRFIFIEYTKEQDKQKVYPASRLCSYLSKSFKNMPILSFVFRQIIEHFPA